MSILYNVLSELVERAKVDSIIEESSINGWRYRKWKSGKVEAWYYYSATGSVFDVWSAPVRYKDISITIPDGIFDSSQNPKAFATSTSNQNWVGFASANIANNAVNVRLLTVVANSLNIYLNFYLCQK